MRLGPHYYVLSLSTQTNTLFEAFRDSLIQVENQGFPICGPAREPEAVDEERCRDLARSVDESFGRYHAREPLGLVVVGVPAMQSAFRSVTSHGAAVIGRIAGDHTATSVRDLGQIVWPVVKEAMSGVLDRALNELEKCAAQGQLVSGLEAVVRSAGRQGEATLLVDDGYHRRGSIRQVNGAPVMISELDVRDVTDDIVDAVIEKVLESAGNVVFTPPGTLRERQRIVLLLRGTASP